jgi:hypothetical protein
MPHLHSRTRTPWSHRIKAAFWPVVAMLAAMAWLSRDSWLLQYRHWKQERALRQAAAFFDAGDRANGELAIDVAFAAEPGGLDARGAASELDGHLGALQALMDAYRARDDARDMREVAAVLRDDEPSSARRRNDWALLSLLTAPTAQWDDAKIALEELYRGDHSNPFYATGYAFALAQAGEGPRALEVVGRLSEDERAYPPRAPYLAYVYGVNGRAADVGRMQAIAAGIPCLREERQLLVMARESLRQGVRSEAESGSAPNP